jgi:hypothetical protein
MAEHEERAHLRDEERRARYEIDREERELAAEERVLEREMDEFEKAEQQVQKKIENEWRTEHWGLEPERPPAWKGDSAPES